VASAALRSEAADDEPTRILMATIMANVRSGNADLSLRQSAVFPNIHLERDLQQTVGGLAAALNISKPAITRALDRSSAFGLIKRERDTRDRRSIVARRTSAGAAHFRALARYLAEAAQT
jgi:DNA-binding MarR family transcriptional regulator